MKTALQILQEAREYLSDPDHWMKGDFADNYEEPCKVCVLGAIHCTAAGNPTADDISHDERKVIMQARSALSATSGWGGMVAGYNDLPSTTHEDIIAWFDRAIELEKNNEDQ